MPENPSRQALGSSDALTELCQGLAPQINRYFLKRTSDEDTARELAANALARAFERRQAFRGVTRVQAMAWMWAIVRNELADHTRACKRERTLVATMAMEPSPPRPDGIDDAQRTAAVSELHALLATALGRLPADQCEVIVRRIWEGLPYADIAARFGVSGDVARARYSRGLRALAADVQLRDAWHLLDE